jgi:type IV secretion system protein VirB4
MMDLMLLKTARQLAGLRDLKCSDFIPWTHLVNRSTFVTKNGAMGSVISVKGLAFEVSDEQKLSENHQQLSRFIQSLSEQCAVYVTYHRHKQNTYPRGEFPEGLARDFNEVYKNKFQHKSLYTNDLYITLMVKGTSDGGLKGGAWFKKYFHKANTDALARFQEKQLELLNQVVREAMESLADYSPVLLGDAQPEAGISSNLLGFLGLLVNGHYRPLAYPLMNLSQYLPERRVSIRHNVLEWQGATKEDNSFAALLSIKQYGHETHTKGLRKLLSADFEFISTHSFCRLPNDKIIDRMKVQLNHLSDVDKEGTSLMDDLREAMDGVRSEYVSFGSHHHTLLVMGDTLKELNEAVSKATDLYRRAELVVVRESLNLEAGFFAQMPGNFGFIARSAPVSNDNFVDFAPLHNYHHGYIEGNHLGSALIQVESQGLTPLYLNLHDKRFGANKENPSSGHTVMVAPPGTGKTTLLCALDLMMKKYPLVSDNLIQEEKSSKFIFFDRDFGCEIYIRSMGGFYTAIQPSHPTGFNPLQLDDTPENRAFLKQWFASLLSSEILPAETMNQIETLIHRNYSLPREGRYLSSIASFLPVDFAYKENLKPWLRSRDGLSPDGDLSYIFDNPQDTLDFEQLTIAGFDMTHLLSPDNMFIVTPVLAYLFHRIELIMDGRLIGINIDEAWQALDTPRFAKKLKNIILTWRKMNVYLVFITQLIGNILSSSLADELIKGTATHIFLANSKADFNEHVKGASLSEAEFNFIKKTGKASRRFLFKQENESAIGRLNLEGMEDFIRIFSGNKANNEICQSIREKIGNDPKDWLPLFLNYFKEAA